MISSEVIRFMKHNTEGTKKDALQVWVKIAMMK